MIYKFKTHCPICHHRLMTTDDAEQGILSYFCRFKPRHYYYLERYHNRDDEQFIRFIIPGYEITYILDIGKYIIYGHDGKTITKCIARFPRIDFDWKDLSALSNRIKKLTTFL